MLQTLKAQMATLLAIAQAGHDVWTEMASLSKRIREEEEAAQQENEAELRDHGFSLLVDGERVATAKTMEQARILSVAMLQTHEDWGMVYVWRYGHEDEGRSEAVTARNHTTRRIYWAPATGG